MPKREKKIGLALSGGAVLGIAHLGAIKVLEEHRIPIDLIAGTSAGSLVGAFLAAGYSSDQLYEMVKSLSWDDIGKVTIPKMGLLNSKELEKFIDDELGRIDITSLPKPYAAVGVDLSTGQQVIFRNGPVSEAVRASCAIPGVFTPLIKDKSVIVDGGVLNFLPTNVVKEMGADYVISIKLMPSITKNKPPQNIIQVLVNSFVLALSQIAEHSPQGDITITPDLTGLNPHDFKQAEKLYRQGQIAALQKIDQIRQELTDENQKKGFLENLKKLF